MPFNPFSALTSKIFGGVSIVLILVVAYLVISNNAAIKAKNDALTAATQTIQAQARDLTTARNNNAELAKALRDQNASIDALAAQGKATAEASAAQLATIRKTNAAEAAQLKAVLDSVPGDLDSCRRAEAMIAKVAEKGL